MKKITIIVTMLLSMGLFSSTASAGCGTEYMSDPCSVDGYGIVQTERYVRGKHNWMHDIHYFGANKRVVKKRVLKKRKRSVVKRRYRYVKRCRLVKVRR
jgi:hypothetical protein